jgi:polysaccharide biosynthesis/export protein
MQLKSYKRYLSWTIAGLLALFLIVSTGGSDDLFGYSLGPRDIIAVAIFAGGEQQVAVDLTITDQGQVNFPFLGPVQAGGFAVNELEEIVVAALKKDYFVAPQVHIQVKEYNSLHFSISGAVKKPGNYKMQAATTIMDLIAKAEGVTMEKGNIAYILRDTGDAEVTGEPMRVNLQKLLDEGDVSHNVMLKPGDSVYIPLSAGLHQSETKVYVSGFVVNPDRYDFQPGLTALSVCIMAGGFARYAAPNRATVIRTENGEQQVIKINLQRVIQGRDEDIPLQPGDRVHVPESWL